MTISGLQEGLKCSTSVTWRSTDTKVSNAELKGHKSVHTKWIDSNKGDAEKEGFRSGLAAMESNRYSDPSLFAATPPLEAMRYLIHRAAKHQQGQKQQLLTIDVKRAYFNSEVTRGIFIEIPKEDCVYRYEDKVGKLRLCLYGT